MLSPVCFPVPVLRVGSHNRTLHGHPPGGDTPRLYRGKDARQTAPGLYRGKDRALPALRGTLTRAIPEPDPACTPRSRSSCLPSAPCRRKPGSRGAGTAGLRRVPGREAEARNVVTARPGVVRRRDPVALTADDRACSLSARARRSQAAPRGGPASGRARKVTLAALAGRESQVRQFPRRRRTAGPCRWPGQAGGAHLGLAPGG